MTAASQNKENSIDLRQKNLQTLVDQTVAGCLAKFAAQQLERNQVAVTLVDLGDPAHPVRASYRGEAPFYPASVIKLFYLVAAHRQMEDGQLPDTPELRRAMHDMIVLSYNEATGYVLDLLTGTTGGPELPPTELDAWREKRNAVNRYFASLGYTNINANKKTWCEGAYGRDAQVLRLCPSERNSLTTDATARLLAEIVTGKAVSAARCREMMELLKRDFANPDNKDTQAREFIGPALPPTARLWSKAGYMSTHRHDAAYIELANGARLVLVIFTEGHSDERDIISALARLIVDGVNDIQTE